MSNGKEPSNLIRLTGLWKSQSGKAISGSLSGFARLVILPNDRKQKNTDPDYYAFLAPSEKREGASDARPESRPQHTQRAAEDNALDEKLF